MKRIFINILSVALMAVALTACHVDSLDNPIVEEQQQADGSLVRVRMNVQIPDPIEVATRAVDPDGNGIQNMTLFCFDGEGLLISTANAILSPNTDSQGNILESGGIFDADIPNTTRVIHLLANQNMAQFKEDEFRNLSEDQVIANLEGSSGMMIYWARVEIPKNVVGNAGILQWITVMTNPKGDKYVYNGYKGENFPIVMLRNQAKVVVDAGGNADAQGRKWDGRDFQVSGFTVVNTQAFGTVAPYHTEYGYPTYACKVQDETNITNLGGMADNWTSAPEFGLTTGSVANWLGTNYINAPRKSDKFSNITDVDTAPQTYVFETENSSADPVSVIIKGCNVVNGVAQAEKYYRVTLTDSEGEQVLVRRNHCYTVNIAGNLLYGVDSFSEALDAPATNNVWLSISDEIKSVQNGNFRLTVEKTSVVKDETQFNATGETLLTLNFNVDKLGNASISKSDLKISWVDSNQDVSPTNVFAVGSNVSFTEGTGVGSITFPLYDFNTQANNGKDMLEGTILVKYGHLQRKIKVIIVRQQKFIPTWVTGQVYKEAGTGGTKIEASNATFVFTIPEDCPAELFPMRVLIATNDLDVRSETGQVLPIIRKGEEGYGEVRTDDIGYKYIYEVTEPGEQFVYLRSILNQETGASINITVEAEHFQTVTKPVVFTDNQRAITVTNVTSFVYVPGTDPSVTNNESNKVYYVYLPQKQYAPWSIDLRMINLSDYADVSVNQYDEFLLYSKNLDAYDDTEVNRVKELLPSDPWLSSSGYFPCQFTSYEADTWGTGGRVHAFMPRYTYWVWANHPERTELNSKFSIYMKTNKAKSAEVIRIASNQLEAQAAFGKLVSYDNVSWTDVYPKNTDGTLYKNKGTVISSYRSMIFELRNYPAFRFAAQVNGVPEYASGYKDLSDDEEENTPVQIDYQPGSEVRVAFDITSFMEEEDDGKVAEVDPFGSEFFVYIQTPDLDLVEGQNNKIQAVDGTPGLYRYKVDNVRANELAGWTTPAIQSNKASERKEIKFRTKGNAIVTEGDIVIYTNQEQIGYKTKTFNVTNAPIAGTITYGAENSPVPADTFVSFSRELDGSRIGSLVVTSNGQYQLRLRKEYDFTWAQQGDSVKLYARINNGSVSKYYVATYPNLKALYDAPNIQLEEEKETE